MATERTTNGLASAPKNKLSVYNMGCKTRKIDSSWTKPAAWVDTDYVVLAKNLSLGERILEIKQLAGSDLAGMTDVDFGLRRSDNGVVLDADILADGVSFATASYRDLLGSGLTFDRTKNLAELLGLDVNDQHRWGVDIIMTINTAGVATGSVPMHIELESDV
jgi:hypothetical protein